MQSHTKQPFDQLSGLKLIFETIYLFRQTKTSHFTLQGVSPDLTEELGRVALKTNYGQFPDTMHAFVGSVALAGAEGGLWAVHGGNRRLPEAMLKESGANLVRAAVRIFDSF